MIAIFFCLALVASAISWSTCLFVKKFGPSFGLIDKPGFRKIHEKPIPTGGGLGVFAGVLLPFAFVSLVALGYSESNATVWGAPLSLLPSAAAERLGGVAARLPQLWSLLGLGAALVVLGTIDDRKGLPWGLRLGVEFLVAIVAVACGWRATFFVAAPWITFVVSVFWIVGLINSFNMLDNMDALSGGVASICALFLAAVAFLLAPNPHSGEPQYFLGGFLLVLVGAILGFLVLNRPPAKMFMGDGGAYFIGFLLATTALSITFVGENTPKTAIFAPICILAVPLYDTISVVAIRLSRRVSPFVGDKNHYSHRLVDMGLSKKQAVGVIYLTTLVCATGALYLYQVNFAAALLVLAQTGLTLSLVAILEFAARKKIRESNEKETSQKNPSDQKEEK